MKNSFFPKAPATAVVLLLASWVTAAAWAQAAPSPSKPAMGADNPLGGERRGPPPESIAACNALKADQACGFMSPKGAEKGTCVKRDASQPLACRPARNGPPPAMPTRN